MSYPGLINEHPYELKEREHMVFHIAENEFQNECEFCKAEKCKECKGIGMTNDCNNICEKCNGRGRIL